MAVLRNKVHEFRDLHGLTRQQLAQAAGISIPTVDSLEDQPGYTPQSRVMLRLCGYFNVPIERLFWIDRDTDDAEQAEAVAV